MCLHYSAQNLGHLPAVLQTITCGAETRLPSGGCIPPVAVATGLGKTLAIWKTTCGAIASTAGVHLSLPPVAPADVPAIILPEIRMFTYGLRPRGAVEH